MTAKRNTVHRLILAGNVMADLLERTADELDQSSGVDPQRTERQVAALWVSLLDASRARLMGA